MPAAEGRGSPAVAISGAAAGVALCWVLAAASVPSAFAALSGLGA
jgi:hypothetical protein